MNKEIDLFANKIKSAMAPEVVNPIPVNFLDVGLHDAELPPIDRSNEVDSESGGDSLEEKEIPYIPESEQIEVTIEPHGNLWVPVGNNEVINDVRPPYMIIKWSHLKLDIFGSSSLSLAGSTSDFNLRDPMHYFLLAFPIDTIHGIVSRTNEKIRSNARNNANLSINSFFIFIGLIYMMTRSTQNSRRDYWKVGSYYGLAINL